jgi:hypothetical protein
MGFHPSWVGACGVLAVVLQHHLKENAVPVGGVHDRIPAPGNVQIKRAQRDLLFCTQSRFLLSQWFIHTRDQFSPIAPILPKISATSGVSPLFQATLWPSG